LSVYFPDGYSPQRRLDGRHVPVSSIAGDAGLQVLLQQALLGLYDATVQECRQHPLNLQAIHMDPEFPQSAG
jgi:hypothetical protein